MANFARHPHPYNTMPRNALASFRRPPSPSDDDHDLDMISPPAVAPERGARYHPRRTSSLSYQNSIAVSRDNRDRSHSRSPKNLVVVIPPPDLPLNQGQLGNVLSVGPRHRLSQGILMPLFPSMFGQLNAIAREYNFPSTIGLCLYLHINENGSTMTPRISDDSWQYLFGHLFDGRSPTTGGQQLPIGGSIEFDIDLNKARWYDSWASGALRDSDTAFPPIVTPRALVETHWRGESQTINADEQSPEERWLNMSASQTLVNSSRPETLRVLPKKLSLVGRLESHGFHVAPKAQDPIESPPKNGTSPSGPPPAPRASESDLERRVKSWRAITEVHPVPMVESYQPTPDLAVTADMTMDEYALEPNFLPTVDIDDFVWSVSSVGPPDSPTATPIASTRPSSVHIDRRANGTVPLTPSTMTSWGPTEEDWHTVVSSATRLPSPDMGQRAVEDVNAPRPRAVWGNSFGWRIAMTWKQAYPYSTRQAIQARLQAASGIVPEYPNMVIYPSVDTLSDAPLPSREPVWGNSFGWHGAVTWRTVYPYSVTTKQTFTSVQLRGTGYPSIAIYPAAYPYFEIYPACGVEENVSQPVSVKLGGLNDLLTCYPTMTIYPAVYPHIDLYPPVSEGVKTKWPNQDLLSVALTLYPNFVIYPAVYPQFDLYPRAVQVAKTHGQEVVISLVNAGALTAEYPHMTIYPSAYPHLEIYPARALKGQASCATWGISFGWLTAKTWLQVYPIHTARPHQSKPVLTSGHGPLIADTVAGKQAVWGTSFGWKDATTWCAVWPTSCARIQPSADPVFVSLRPQSELVPSYPFLAIYPAAYPYFDIYLAQATVANEEEPQPAKNQLTIHLIPHYPNVLIYPATYPHFDLYPAFARSVIAASRKGKSDLRRRRIEMWRAKTAAQVGLIELVTNNHNWEVDEPLQLNLADYAWSRTSAGPRTPPELDTPSIAGSVHLDRRIRGSVPRTPSTATTWGPQDDDWRSEISSIDRLPSPDLGQRAFDDADDIFLNAWDMVWPFFTLLSAPGRSVYVPEYPHMVIYPLAYPHFDLYPTWENSPASVFKNQVTETLTSLNVYPAIDVYPAVYPHFNIYPKVGSQIEIPSQAISSVRYERVEGKVASPYYDFDNNPTCYPYSVDYAYPFVNTKVSGRIADASRGYPLLVVYPPVYPYIILYPGSSAEICPPLGPELSLSLPKSVNIKLAVQYPLLDIYPAGYPRSLESIYPAVSIEIAVDDCSTMLKALYPCICIYATVYPFVQPYPSLSDSIHTPGALDEVEYGFAQACLTLMELEPVYLAPTVYPHIDLYPALSLPAPEHGPVQVAPLPRTRSITRRQRKTHLELHASVFRCLEKRRAQGPKTHRQLHNEVFQDGVVWTPSGYIQDISSLMTRRGSDIPMLNLEPPRRRPSHESPAPRTPRSRSGTPTTLSADKIVFPLAQPPALPPIAPFRVRSAGGVPSPAVSETPIPRISSPPPSPYTHMRSTSARLSQAVRSMMPGTARRNSSAGASANTKNPMPPLAEEHKERAKGRQSPTRFLSLVDRRPAVVPPLPHPTSEFLTRPPRSPPTKDSLVLQRARAYEQSAAANHSSGPIGIKGAHTPFILPPLPPMPPMTDVAEVIEKSKTMFV